MKNISNDKKWTNAAQVTTKNDRLKGTVRRVNSWPLLAATTRSPTLTHLCRPNITTHLLEIDYEPAEESPKWRRRYSERLQRRRAPPGRPPRPPAALHEAKPSGRPHPGLSDVSTELAAACGRSPVSSAAGAAQSPAPSGLPAAKAASAKADVARERVRPSGAVPRRLTHARSHSATLPAFVAAASDIAVAVAGQQPQTGPVGRPAADRSSRQCRPPAAPAKEALPSPQDHQLWGFIPRSYPYKMRQGSPAAGPSFVESGGGHSLVYGLDGYFPKPQQGQSLTEFLGSHDFKRNIAELDRENAHFRISESLIAAFEMVGAEMRMLTPTPSDPGGTRRRGTSSSIRDLRRRLVTDRLARRPPAADESSAAEREHLISDTSGSPSSCSGLSDVELPDEKSDPPAAHTGSTPPRLLRSVSSAPVAIPSSRSTTPGAGATPPARAATQTAPPPAQEGVRTHRRSVTAENVALALLAQFPEKQALPKASELVWLVGEDQVPQSLLPMPSVADRPLLSDDGRHRAAASIVDSATCDAKPAPQVALRGTNEWAPPRAQIIFSLHKQGKRSVAMARQSHRCAGCGLKVSPQLANKFRWCEYLGRYFCANCHENQTFYIPARIIHKHDYNKYPVSLFSHQLLLSIWRDPLFHVNTINPAALSYADLHQCRLLRKKLSIAQKYVATCRFAKQLLRTHPLPEPYLLEEIDLYSLRDLVEAGSRALTDELQHKYDAYLQHCRLCQLCCGRGYLCEPCRHHRPLFPFELPDVRQCEVCGACYHYLCFPERGGCLKCRRLRARRAHTQAETAAPAAPAAPAGDDVTPAATNA